MTTRVYCDTARLGRMTPTAQRIQIELARWAGEESGSLYFDAFLKHGFSAWPTALQNRFSGLSCWRGLAQLRRDLRTLAGARDESRVLLANRSSQLMRFVARLLFASCRNVLVTDLSWPTYAEILAQRARATGGRITKVSVRDAILRGTLGRAELIDRVVTTFQRQQCDGLFLPAVDNGGIRLPWESLVWAIRRRCAVRFVVIDGAQAFGHVPAKLAHDDCDFYIAGCHKWLQGYLPLGLGFYGRRQTQSFVDAVLKRRLARQELDDPLLAFTEDVESGQLSPFGETVNLASLFTASGAIADALARGRGTPNSLTVQFANANLVSRIAHSTGWYVLRPQAEFRTGIVLLRSKKPEVRVMEPETLRRGLLQHGVAATTYRRGIVRLSMPRRPWQPFELAVIETAFKSMAYSSVGSISTSRNYLRKAHRNRSGASDFCQLT